MVSVWGLRTSPWLVGWRLTSSWCMGVQAVLSGSHYRFIPQKGRGAFKLLGWFLPPELLFWIRRQCIQLVFDDPVFVNGGLYVDIRWIFIFDLGRLWYTVVNFLKMEHLIVPNLVCEISVQFLACLSNSQCSGLVQELLQGFDETVIRRRAWLLTGRNHGAAVAFCRVTGSSSASRWSRRYPRQLPWLWSGSHSWSMVVTIRTTRVEIGWIWSYGCRPVVSLE